MDRTLAVDPLPSPELSDRHSNWAQSPRCVAILTRFSRCFAVVGRRRCLNTLAVLPVSKVNGCGESGCNQRCWQRIHA
jgi:hypothetical protein